MSKHGQRRFSTIILLSMLVLQALLTGLMFCFFYGLSKHSITQNFEQELALTASNVNFTLSNHVQSLTTRLSDICADNALRVALRLDMITKTQEILDLKQKNSSAFMHLYLLRPDGTFFPEPEKEVRQSILATTNIPSEVFDDDLPHAIKTTRGFLALVHKKVALTDGKSLGEVFLTCDLSHIFSGEAPGSERVPLVAIESQQDNFNLFTAEPMNLHASKFLDENAIRPLKSPFHERLYFIQPYTSLRNMTNQLLVRFLLFGVLSFVATTVLAAIVIRKHGASLKDMVANAAALAGKAGNQLLPVRPDEFREFQELSASFNQILHDLRMSRDEVRQLNSDLEGRVNLRTGELSETNRLLQSREQQLKQVVEHIPVATCMFDTRMNALYSSLMWNELFRLAVPQNQGKHFLELVPEYREYWEKAFGDCLKGKIRHCSEKRMMIFGREYWLRWEAHPWASATAASDSPSRLERSVGGVIVFMEDITSQKWSQEALQRSADEAGIANRLKSEFLANVSHEIRTPLNCIIGFAEIISAAKKMDEIHRHAELILSESDTLLVLINDLLDFSKIEAGKLETDGHDFDLQQLFDDITPGVRLRLRKKPVSFSTEISAEVPRYLHGDSFRLRQIIMNLVHNAVKFTEKGYIILTATLNAPLPGGYKILFSVEDTGIGIPADKQKSIFDKFTQADGSTTRRYGGTGLGTSISKKLVEIMGGSIGLKSVAGKGSTFWFTIPFTPADEPERTPLPTPADAARPEDEAQALHPILLTEDYLPNQMVARTHLESAGYKVEIANNGKEACAMIQQNSYALILMDLSMPEMDGYEATEAIRKIMGERHLPIIALTASAEPSVRIKCLKAGFDDILAKPIRRADLLAVIEKWLEYFPARQTELATAAVVGGESVAPPADSEIPPAAKPETPDAPPAHPAEALVPVTPEGAVAQSPAATQAASSPHPLATGDPVDFAALQTDYPGKHSMIRKLLLQFYDILGGQIELLQKAVVEQDVEVLRGESHKLIGGAGTLRANIICEAAKSINDAAKEGNFARCAQEVSIIAEQRVQMDHVLKKRYTQPE